MTAAKYGAALLARLAALCEADPSREACGFVLRRGGGLEVVQLENVADRYHASDPEAFPRTSRDSYLMDPRAQLRLHEELAASGGEIAAVWHSHVELGARFSEQDRLDAVMDGAPVLAGAEYLVLGVRGGRVVEVKRYGWDGAAYAEVT